MQSGNLYGLFLKNGSEETPSVVVQSEHQPTPISVENEFQPSLFETEIPGPEIEIKEIKTTLPIIDPSINQNSDIYKIVVFYKDGTFQDFKPRD